MAYTTVPPSPVAVGDPTAVFGRRCLAAGIDAAIVVGPAVALTVNELTLLTREQYEDEWAPANGGIPFEAYCGQYESEVGGICERNSDLLVVGSEPSVAPDLLAIGTFLVLAVLLQGLTGWTIGKLLTGIRTVKADGSACGIPRAAVRSALWLVDGQPCGIPAVGFITGLTTQGHRRVGDMGAKTFVVRRGAMGSPIIVPGLTAPPPPGPSVAPPGAPVWTPPTAPPAPNGAAWLPPPVDAPDSPPVAPPTAASPPPPSWGEVPPAAAPAPPGVEAPHWDEERGAYIQWDPDEAAWMQWDDPGQRWFRIGGQ